MKSNTRLGAFVLSAIAGCALAVFAGQQPGGGQGPMMMGGPPNPQRMLEMRLARMTKILNLTANQQAKIKPILADQMKQARAIFQDNSLSREDRRTKFMALRQKTMKKIRPILTAAQRPKLREAMAPPRRMMRGGPMGPPAGPPPQQ